MVRSFGAMSSSSSIFNTTPARFSLECGPWISVNSRSSSRLSNSGEIQWPMIPMIWIRFPTSKRQETKPVSWLLLAISSFMEALLEWNYFLTRLQRVSPVLMGSVAPVASMSLLKAGCSTTVKGCLVWMTHRTSIFSTPAFFLWDSKNRSRLPSTAGKKMESAPDWIRCLVWKCTNKFEVEP